MKTASDVISRLGFTPAGRKLDVEVFPFTDILRRSSPTMVRATHRYDFHLLVLVTEGSPKQVVDFEPVQCAPGHILSLSPGQVHSFGTDPDWDGWMVLFRPEFLPTVSDLPADLTPGRMLERMPDRLALDQKAFQTTRQAIVVMADDARSDAPVDSIHTLLRYQLCTLLMRLDLFDGQQNVAASQGRSTFKRFAKFRKLLEANYTEWHQVGLYAKALGCTQKSLNRSSQDAMGLNAKDYIAQRVALEAKRLLVHTDTPIYLIAQGLGFDEATNFSKFFRNNTGQSPAEFRAAYR